MSYAFSWHHPRRWPHDPPGYVFLARAFDEIGRAMYGADWVRLRRLVEDDIDDTDDSADNHDAAEAELDRMSAAVKGEIVRSCEAGELSSALRSKEGGEMTLLEPHLWNTEHYENRFRRCAMSLEFPFPDDDDDDHVSSTRWIFLSRDSLAVFLLGQPYAVSQIRPDTHLSPYLKIMLFVIEKLKITPAHQPKKEEVIQEINDAWSGSSQLSKKLAEVMATLVREPDSQLGRAKKKT